MKLPHSLIAVHPPFVLQSNFVNSNERCNTEGIPCEFIRMQIRKQSIIGIWKIVYAIPQIFQ